MEKISLNTALRIASDMGLLPCRYYIPAVDDVEVAESDTDPFHYRPTNKFKYVLIITHSEECVNG